MSGTDDAGCGCSGSCAGTAEPDPVVSNQPGLASLAYRSGTHASVLRRMVTAVRDRLPALAAGGTDDPAVGLLDAWATVADIVTFYQERIANEGFLRTATERRSVAELARAIGYELRPGVSATTYLDLRVLEAAAGPATTPATSPPTALVRRGTRVVSLPAQGQLPRTFETDQDITVGVDRNQVPVRQAAPQQFAAGRDRFWVAGAATGLRPGDGVLVAEHTGDESAPPASVEFRVLTEVRAGPAAAPDLPAATLLVWSGGLEHDYAEPEVHAVEVRAALFGYNAPDWRIMPLAVKRNYTTDETVQKGPAWPGFDLADTTVLQLDAVYPGLRPGSLLVLRQPAGPASAEPAAQQLFRVRSAEPDAQQDFGISAKTTRVTLDRADGVRTFDRRAVVVHTQTRLLPAALEPIITPVTGAQLDLATPASLVAGQQVVVTGTAAGVPYAQPARLTAVDPPPPGLPARITLDHDLPGLDRSSVRILGNIVPASHGETVPEEVLGSGDGAVPNQRFTLRKPGLTQLPAQVSGGVAPALEVRVDGVLWTPVPSLFLAGPHDRVYVVRIGDDGAATLVFGDGLHGARLPSGQENVRARYRVGVGPDGEVPAHALALLPQRPLGVSAVDNPLASGGDAPPEKLEDARANAPLAVLTLDRVVSLRDHEDYARAFGGIARARAVSLHGRTARFVHLTLAGPGGAAVPARTIETLLATLAAFGDPAVDVRASSRTLLTFGAGLGLLTDPSRVEADVRAAVRDALASAFSADRRGFAEPVTTSQLLDVAQRVTGVIAAVVRDLAVLASDPPGAVPPSPDRVTDPLPAGDARLAPTPDDPEHVAPGQVLLIDPGHVTFSELNR